MQVKCLENDSFLTQSIMNEDVYSVDFQNSITQKTSNYASIMTNDKYISLFIRAKKIKFRQVIHQNNIGIVVFRKKKYISIKRKLLFSCLHTDNTLIYPL